MEDILKELKAESQKFVDILNVLNKIIDKGYIATLTDLFK